MSNPGNGVKIDKIYGGTHLSFVGTNGKDIIDIPKYLYRVGRTDGDGVSSGEHHVYGYGGDDMITGEMRTTNCVFGGTGDDIIKGGNIKDYLVGDSGSDTIYGYSGHDTIKGGTGDDFLYGGAGADKIYGEADDDFIIGGPEHDIIDGGSGIDTVSYLDAAAPVCADLSLEASCNVDSMMGGMGGMGMTSNVESDTLTNIENLIGSAHHGDVLIGSDGANEIRGLGGNDKIKGGGGNDLLEGGAGADTLEGGDGNDTASYASSVGGVNVSLVARTEFNNGFDTSVSSSFANVPQSGTLGVVNSANKIQGGGIEITNSEQGSHAHGDILINIENLIGSAHDDVLVGNEFVNVLNGGTGGVDKFYGGGSSEDCVSYEDSNSNVFVYLGKNSLNGGGATGDELYGIENLIGSSGNDILSGDGKDNDLQGGSGNDQYYFGVSGGSDQITDANEGVSDEGVINKEKIYFLSDKSYSYDENDFTFSSSDAGDLIIEINGIITVPGFGNVDKELINKVTINDYFTTDDRGNQVADSSFSIYYRDDSGDHAVAITLD